MVVFLTALVTLCVSAWLVTLHKKKEGQEEGEEGRRDDEEEEGVVRVHRMVLSSSRWRMVVRSKEIQDKVGGKWVW